MRSTILALAALGLTWTAPALAQSGISLSIDSDRINPGQGWAVGFSEGGAGCIAVARYRDGTRVWFGVSAKHGRFIAFANAAWKSVVPGGSYELRVLPNGGTRWRTEAIGVSLDGEGGVLSGSLKPDVMEDLAKASGFSVELAGRKIFGGELSGSRRALALAFDCFARNQREAERVAANRAPPPKEKNDGPPRLAGNGTGFFVSPDGHIVTNDHVTQGCRAVSVGVPGSDFVTASIRATDPVNDLSLLKIPSGPPWVPAFRTSLKLGESVAVFGYPLSNVGLATAGNFTMGYISALAGLKNDTREYQISAPVQPGNSGGPMVDHMGNIVGVINAKLNALNVALKQGDIPQNVNFAIKASVAQNFLETNGIRVPGEAATRKLEPTELAEHLKSFSLRVNCLK